MNRNDRKELLETCNGIFKEYAEGMLKQVESKYAEALEERASNDVGNMNYQVKQAHPEVAMLAFQLKNGELAIPFKSNTDVRLFFKKGDFTKEVILDMEHLELVDLTYIMDNAKDFDICVIKTVTKQEVTMFDDEKFNKEKVVEKITKDWEQVYEGFYRCEDLVAVYQTISKFKN